MKALLLLLPLLLALAPQARDASSQTASQSPVIVLGFKWHKSRQKVVNPDNSPTAPASEMIQANKNFERNVRANAPVGIRDPNEETVDGRRAAIEKNVQEARSPKFKQVDGYDYRARVRNAGTKVVEVLFWEYQFAESSNPSNVARRQFLCGVNIKPNKEKELQAFGLAGPGDVVSAGGLAADPEGDFQERVVINRVEYADGAIWQREGWSYAEIRPALQRALSTPWGSEMCRSL